MRCAVKRSGGENARSLKYDGRPYCFVPECDWGLIVAKAWGGRFNGKTDPRVEKFTESISFDARLAAVDIKGSVILILWDVDSGNELRRFSAGGTLNTV